MKKITLLLICLSFSLCMYSQQTISFETSEGFALGDIHNQVGWTSTGCGDGCNVENQVISDEQASDGTLSLKIVQETAFGGQANPVVGGFYDYAAPVSNTMATFSADFYIDTFDSANTSDYLFGLTNLTEGSFRTYIRFTFEGDIFVLVDDGTGTVDLIDTTADWTPLTWFNMRIEIDGANVEFFINDVSIYSGLTATVGDIENVRFVHDNFLGFAYMDNFRTNDEDLSVDSFDKNQISHFYDSQNKSFNITSSSAITSVKIYDILGKNVVNKTTNTTLDVTNLSTFEKGVYLAQIQTEQGIKTVKFVKN